MVLLWLLKITYGIAFYEFVIESKLFLDQWYKKVNHLNPIEFYHIKNQFFYIKLIYQSPLIGDIKTKATLYFTCWNHLICAH